MTFAEYIYGHGCLSTRRVQITLQLYIVNIQDIFCWNRSQDNHLSHWQDVWPSTVMNKRLIFLFLFVLHSDPLCLVHLELLATCSRVEREDPLYFLSQSPPVLTLRKSSFLAICRRTWEIFILHTKPKHLYITMQVLYRRFCVPLLWSVWVTYLCWENMGEHFKLQCFVLNYCDSV